ncbi:MAG: hypothetical protein Kow00124_11400 [Anaerolineae bacterium]
MTPETFFSILGWIVTGSIAGYLASLLLRAERQGCLINIGIGIAGAFVGAFVIRLLFPRLFYFFGTGAVAGFFNSVLHAVIGAVILLVLAELLLPGQQLGIRGERRSSKKRRR